MKTTNEANMNTNPQPKRSKKGFTLIEMIGVLAVIAILAALLIPKIFEAINNARISSSALVCNTVKTAIADHYAKFGSLLSSNGIVITASEAANFDKILMAEGFLDKPFAVKISSDTTNRVQIVTGVGTNAPSATGGNYDLDGDGTTDTGGASVVEAVITDVVTKDAMELSRTVDGAPLSEVGPLVGDVKGRVVYTTPSAAGITTVHVYLTHR